MLSICLTLAANFLWNGVLPEIHPFTFSAVYVVCSIIRQFRIDPTKKSVLITGCDSGFGFLLAKNLKDEGCDVIATSLFPTGDAAKELAQKNIKVIKCDVSSQDDIDALIVEVEKHLDGKPLHGVVNNAGISAFGDVEWASINVYKRVSIFT